MIRRLIYLLTLLLLDFIQLCGQDVKNDTTYFDKDWKKCNRNSAEYFRVVKQEGTTFFVTDYYINNHPQMRAVCSQVDSLIKNGKCTFYDKLGNIESEGLYKNNKETGVWFFAEYYGDGKKSRTSFSKDGLLDSVLTEYYKFGNLYSTCFYKNDTLNGLKTIYREDGSIFSTSNYSKGERDGWYIWYKKNGTKDYEEEYINGKKTGSRRLYFKNGQVQGEYIWAKKRIDGYKIWYYENGAIQSKVTFVNGKRTKIIRSGKQLK